MGDDGDGRRGKRRVASTTSTTRGAAISVEDDADAAARRRPRCARVSTGEAVAPRRRSGVGISPTLFVSSPDARWARPTERRRGDRRPTVNPGARGLALGRELGQLRRREAPTRPVLSHRERVWVRRVTTIVDRGRAIAAAARWMAWRGRRCSEQRERVCARGRALQSCRGGGADAAGLRHGGSLSATPGLRTRHKDGWQEDRRARGIAAATPQASSRCRSSRTMRSPGPGEHALARRSSHFLSRRNRCAEIRANGSGRLHPIPDPSPRATWCAQRPGVAVAGPRGEPRWRCGRTPVRRPPNPFDVPRAPQTP